jgi:hypothetical protein
VEDVSFDDKKKQKSGMICLSSCMWMRVNVEPVMILRYVLEVLYSRQNKMASYPD